jgi:hypothetical protein
MNKKSRNKEIRYRASIEPDWNIMMAAEDWPTTALAQAYISHQYCHCHGAEDIDDAIFVRTF